MIKGFDEHSVSDLYECDANHTFHRKPWHHSLRRPASVRNEERCKIERISAFCARQMHQLGCENYDGWAMSMIQASCRISSHSIPGCQVDCTGANYTNVVKTGNSPS